MICVPNNYEPTNELVWCPGRYTRLTRCPRSYYYHYIGSWGGWSKTASDLSQHLYHLKYLTSPSRETIRIVREVIAGILLRAVSGIRNSDEDEIAVAQRIFKSYIERSAGLPLNELSRKKTKLLNDFLGKSLTKAAITRLCKHLTTLLRGFYSFSDLRDLIRSPSALIPEFLRPGEFEINHHLGVPARIGVDPIWIAERSIVVGRWCTGTPASFHTTQALTIDVYIRSRLRIPDDSVVEHRYYYLESRHCITRTFDESERAEHRKTISQEFARLQSYCDDEIISTAPGDRFPGNVTHSCVQCQFQTVCGEFRKTNLTLGINEQ